ncbi:hypothetical protein M0804_012113 [Polistes exclamans]|nr:hypothetical protein M0804_012113 [Polistes exclamans]
MMTWGKQERAKAMARPLFVAVESIANITMVKSIGCPWLGWSSLRGGGRAIREGFKRKYKNGVGVVVGGWDGERRTTLSHLSLKAPHTVGPVHRRLSRVVGWRNVRERLTALGQEKSSECIAFHPHNENDVVVGLGGGGSGVARAKGSVTRQGSSP